MKTIDLPEELSFPEALRSLLDGKCIGIRPDYNLNFIEMFKPHWMNPESSDYLLRWHGDGDDTGIRTNQFLGTWTLVIVDHQTLQA